MDVTPEELRGWIREGEGRRLEFKSGLPRPERTARVLAAFANTRGGILLVGVTDRGAVCGVAGARKVLARLREIAAERVAPPLSVELRAVRLEEGDVVCCSVPLSPARPHAVRGENGELEVVVRVGSSNRAADGATRRAVEDKPRLGSLDELQRKVLAWVTRHTGGGDAPNGGATVASFAQAHNVGVQRARRAFVALERAGHIVGHGRGARRVYGAP